MRLNLNPGAFFYDADIFLFFIFYAVFHFSSSTSCDTNARNLVFKRQKLVGFQFRPAPTANFISCVKACLRVGLCASV